MRIYWTIIIYMFVLRQPVRELFAWRQNRLVHMLQKKMIYLYPLLRRGSKRTEQKVDNYHPTKMSQEQLMELDLVAMQQDLPHSLEKEIESTITMEDIHRYSSTSANIDMDVDMDVDTIVNNAKMESMSPTQHKVQEMSDILHKVVPELTTRIKKYHELFSQPLIAEFWEETLHNALQDAGYASTWKPDRSHKVGEDMRIEGVDGSRISCKSGQIITPRGGIPSVKFNGSRTTSQDSIDEKINHLCGDHDDWYFLLAKKKNFDNTYKLLVFESSKCKVNQLQWCENNSGKQWIGTGLFQASINKSMSSQLWTTLPMNMVTLQYDIVM